MFVPGGDLLNENKISIQKPIHASGKYVTVAVI